MKSKFTLLTVILIFFGLLVQGQGVDINSNPYNAEQIDQFEMKNDYKPLEKADRHINRRGGVSIIPIGSSYNIYSILLHGQNQVMYNSAINTVTFLHRQNDGGAGGSGVLTFDVSTDGGASWDLNKGPLTPGIVAGTALTDGARYPSSTIYNPSGNTDPANAYIVGIGPALEPGASWKYHFQVSAKLDGTTDVAENYTGSPGAPWAFHPYALSVNPNGDMWAISTRYNNTANDTFDTITSSRYYLLKGVFNTTSKSVEWSTVDSLKPLYYQYKSLTTDLPVNLGGAHNMTFSPDGQTGYAVILAGEIGGTDSVPKPVVWKSSDAGVNWNKLPDFDFTSIPLISDWTVPRNGDSKPVPYFSSMDLTVDKNGRLHMFTELLSQFNNSPDSVSFIFANPQGSGAFTSFAYDLHTSNGADWEAFMIDTVSNGDGALPNGSGGNVAIDFRPQVSRTEDGSKLFFSWAESNNLITGTTDNILPDVHGRGYDVDSMYYTDIKNFTQGTAAEGISRFPTMSPISIVGGTDQEWEMPIVYAVTGFDALDPPQYYFLKGAGFSKADFGDTTIISVDPIVRKLEMLVYPNPVSDAINVLLPLENDLSVTVSDMLGRTVYLNNEPDRQLKIATDTWNEGIYMIRLEQKGMTGFTVKKFIITR